MAAAKAVVAGHRARAKHYTNVAACRQDIESLLGTAYDGLDEPQARTDAVYRHMRLLTIAWGNDELERLLKRALREGEAWDA